MLPSINTEKPLIDIQSSKDARNLAINHVGVKSVRYPVRIETPLGVQATTAMLDMYVALPADVKGTHMSRLLEVVGTYLQTHNLNTLHLKTLMLEMLERLEAQEGFIRIHTPYFIEKTAPVSGVKSLMDYELTFEIQQTATALEVFLTASVPVKSLCPCSKNISEYGAHNQRSHIKVKALVTDAIDINSLIKTIEQQGSSEIWSILKREDEKFITEKAYDNPKFVEDLVRDVAIAMNHFDAVLAYELSAENFESIHNHSAYAEITADKRSGF